MRHAAKVLRLKRSVFNYLLKMLFCLVFVRARHDIVCRTDSTARTVV